MSDLLFLSFIYYCLVIYLKPISVRHGKEARNYEQVITSSKLWYKVACGIVSISTDENVFSLESMKEGSMSTCTIETSLLRTPLKHLLGFISNVENWRNENVGSFVLD